MKWLNNLEALAEGRTEVCPYCGSKYTEYGFTMIDNKKKIGYGAIWCNDCQRGYHISRILLNDEMPMKSIPKNIVLE